MQIYEFLVAFAYLCVLKSDKLETRPTIPDEFIAQQTRLIGSENALRLAESLETASPVSVRMNSAKRSSLFSEAELVPWCTTGRFLDKRPEFTLNPLLHAGAFYVQEAASMFLEQAYNAFDEIPQRVLDLCAAPGGKSTLWRSLLPEGALLVANEPLRQRAMILAENLAKWGHADVVVTQAYPEEFAALRGFFDVIATDVPCSGEGMFRKDDDARRMWSMANVAMCAERQRKILSDVWPALRNGGWIVYSTCTFNDEENEKNVQFICEGLGAEVVPLSIDPAWGIVDTPFGYHFYPHLTRSEGFFIALLRKTSPSGTQKMKIKHRPLVDFPKWLKNNDEFVGLRSCETLITAVRKSIADDVLAVGQTVRCLSAGIAMAEEIKGKKTVPQHPLALALDFDEAVFPRVSLSLDEALSYLRRETLCLPADVPRGYVNVVYEDHSLGFVNNLGNRANNMYPQEWRIRRK